MDIFGILSMIGGLALFLYGMEAMGSRAFEAVRRPYGTSS